MWYAIIGVIVLYAFYRASVTYLFPKWSEWKLKKYRDKFLEKNPHIDQSKLPPLPSEKESETLLDKRKKYR